MRRAAGLLVVTALAAVGGTSGTAGAVENENHVGVDLGVPILVAQRGNGSSTLTGATLGLHYTRGLTDAFDLVADGGWSALPAGTSSFATLSNAEVGLAYVLDVLQWVPWASIEAGGYALTGNSIGGTTVLPGASIAIGVEYRFDRSWAAGIVLRQHFLFTDASTFPSFTQGLLRFEYTWGW
jgi:hypothetical protein